MSIKKFSNYKKTEHFPKWLSFLSIAVLLIFIFFIYFYSTFVKFQINYASIYNKNTISKLKEFNNDVIKLSSTLYTDFRTRNFFNDDETGIFKNETADIRDKLSASIIGDNVCNLIVSNHSNGTVYHLQDGKKYTKKDFIRLFPEYEDIAEKNIYGLSTQMIYGDDQKKDRYSNYFVSTYNTNSSYTVSLFFRYEYFERSFFQNGYPIFYGMVIADGNNSVLTSGNNPDLFKISESLSKKGDFSKISDKYIITKNSSGIISCISAVKITDLLRESLSAGSFLLVIALLFALIIGIISYYFKFKQHILTEKLDELKSHNTETALNLIIQKMFNSDTITKNDEVISNNYFLLNEGKYFFPFVLGICDRSIDDGTLKQKDVNLYKFGFDNIITEVLGENAKIKSQNIGKNCIAFLLYTSTPVNTKEIKSKLIYCADFIKKNFSVDIYTTLGYTEEDFLSLCAQISQLMNIHEYRLQETEPLFFKDIAKTTEKSSYPYHIQDEILNAVCSHDKEHIRSSLYKFEEYAKKVASKDRKNYFLKLVFEIYEQSKSNDSLRDITIAPNTIKEIFECGNSEFSAEKIINSITYSKNTQKTEKNQSESEFSNQIIAMIEENYSNSSFCIQFIIEKIGLTAPYFGKKFNREFGKSFNAYLLEYRLEKAKDLILHTEYTNNKIASLCGFNSESYFVNIFRKNIGVSPKKYKTEYPGKNHNHR